MTTAPARDRLREDFEAYPPKALRIVAANGEEVPFNLKAPQLRMARGLMAQRAAGLPMRAIIVKARKVGFSTQAQGLVIQRATQTPHHYALVVAQGTKAVGEIFGIGKFMHARLPPQIRPEITAERNGRGEKMLEFGQPSRNLRLAGDLGLDSTIEVSTATEVDAGRGMTIRTLHLSEVAHWKGERGAATKLALKNAVPDDPESMILEESTANGHNHFKDDWDAAVAGESGYLAIFTPWFEEPTYRLAFASKAEMQQFDASIGTGKYGDDEPELAKLIPEKIREWEAEWGWPRASEKDLRRVVLECLKWRRWAIPAKCNGDVDQFHQEYPSTAEEAFLSSGRRVFPAKLVSPVLRRCERTDPVTPTAEHPGPARGAFKATKFRTVRLPRGETLELPLEVEWVPKRKLEEDVPAHWLLWQRPVQAGEDADGKPTPAGRYVGGIDVMSGEENEGALARHAIVMIDHRSLRMVALYDSQADVDVLTHEAVLAGLFFNRAILAPEITGGWGIPVANGLGRKYHYPRVFRRDDPADRMSDPVDRLGFSTDARTKPLMEARGVELLREGTDGIVSRLVAQQMLSYVRDKRGRSQPEPGKLSDALMAWLIAQVVAQQSPIPRDPQTKKTSSSRRKVRGAWDD